MRRIGLVVAAVLSVVTGAPAGWTQAGDVYDLHQEQAKEKIELEKMKKELDDVKSTMSDSLEAMSQVEAQMKRPRPKELHLFAREANCEVAPGVTARFMTYNGQVPGPPMRLEEGDVVRVVLHNQLKTPTSLHFHGMLLPHAVDGLPRQGAGLVGPGETFTYQFVVEHPGTYWYHPQVVHAEQQALGLYGAIVVEPKSMPKTYEKDIPLIVGQHLVSPRQPGAQPAKPAAAAPARPGAAASTPSAPAAFEVVSPLAAAVTSPAVTYYTVNGKSAPGIPAIEVSRGERVRLRVINASQEVCPLHLSGHRFEVAGVNGSDGMEPHVIRDTVAVNPGDRLDLEFTADNPGVWSLFSSAVRQSTTQGKFPGGIAVVVRYKEAVSAR